MRIFNTSVIFMLLLYGVAVAATPADTPPNSSDDDGSRDCAANSLFLLAKMCDVPVSYDRCLELLPPSHDGNSVRDVKQAMEQLGFSVPALRLQPAELIGVKVPSIAWVPAARPPAGAEGLGHFFVIRPLSAERVQILDFPAGAPQVFLTSQWLELLRAKPKIDLFLLPAAHSSQDPATTFDSKAAAVALASTPPVALAVKLMATDKFTQIDLKDAAITTAAASWSFGEMPEGSTVQHDFILKNLTSRDLHVVEVRPNCGCTKVQIDKKLIPVGGSATISTQISLEGRHGTLAATVLTLFAPTDNFPPQLVDFHGKIAERWVCEPALISLGDIDPATPELIRNLVISPGPASQLLNAFKLKLPDGITARDISSSEEIKNNARRLELRIHPNVFAGEFSSNVDIMVSNQSEPAATCVVVGQIHEEWAALPRSVFLGSKPQSLQIVCEDRDKALKVLSATVSEGGSALFVEPLSSTDPHIAIFSIHAKPNAPRWLQGIIEFKVSEVDGSNPKTLKVPVVHFSP
jgi:hypothetical protein